MGAATAGTGAASAGVSASAGADLWSLHARTDLVTAAAEDWRAVARAAARAAFRVRAATDPLPQTWGGDSQRAYFAHREGLLGAVTTMSTMAGSTAEALDRIASVLATAQDHLDDAWRRLRRAVPAVEPPMQWLLQLGSGRVAQAYRQAVAEARDIRAHAELALVSLGAALGQERLRLEAPLQTLTVDVNREWQRLAELSAPGEVILDGGRAVVDASGADDRICVETDPATGGYLVTLTSPGRAPVVRRFPVDVSIVVRAGDGADSITVAPDVQGVTVLAGDGDDLVRGGDRGGALYGGAGRDMIIAGSGADYLSGGDGVDYLDGGSGDDDIAGGRGRDTLYGLDGADSLWGGDGADYLDGGRGTDMVCGGDGNDIAFGGRDADTILGGDGNDRLYGGGGTDRIDGGQGQDDRAFAQSGDDVRGVDQRTEVELTDAGAFIRVDGDAHFVDRVQSDLDALRSSPDGEQMLLTLEMQHMVDGDDLVVTEFDGHNGLTHSVDRWPSGAMDRVEYNPTLTDLPTVQPAPPLVVLYHELAHVDDSFRGTFAGGVYGGADNPGVPNFEREAVGLPIDDDHNPATPDRLDPDHPWALTENGFRQELGLPARPSY